jgi:hypothetical protein
MSNVTERHPAVQTWKGIPLADRHDAAVNSSGGPDGSARPRLCLRGGRVAPARPGMLIPRARFPGRVLGPDVGPPLIAVAFTLVDPRTAPTGGRPDLGRLRARRTHHRPRPCDPSSPPPALRPGQVWVFLRRTGGAARKIDRARPIRANTFTSICGLVERGTLPVRSACSRRPTTSCPSAGWVAGGGMTPDSGSHTRTRFCYTLSSGR